MAGWKAPRDLFGSRLRELRATRHLSQEKLGHLAGLDRNYVGQIERGHRAPGLENIVKLAMALGVCPGTLFEPFTRETLRRWEDEDEDAERYT